MNTKTEMTGRTAKTCTGTNNRNVKVRHTVGDRVYFRYLRVNDEGCDVSGLAYGTITKIGVGTEYGMNGTTALCELTMDEGDTRLLAARHLCC